MHENNPSARRRMPVAGRRLAALTAGAGLACAAGLAAGSPAHAAASPFPELAAVSADSASDAWSVGYGYNATTAETTTLALHWNGTSWVKVKTPNPAGANNALDGVAATSPTSAWAVGDVGSTPLMLHWNGTSWTKVALPSFTGNFGLGGVSADSATDAWAVGQDNNSTANNAVVLHWNGTAWSQVSLPNPAGVTLAQVKALSPTDVWAGGATTSNTTAVMLHWDGTSWTQTTLPNPSGVTNSSVHGIGASSATNAWAVGTYTNTNYLSGVTSWHLAGSAWSPVSVPIDQPAGTPFNQVNGVDTRSATSAWAVGLYAAPNNSGAPLAMKWNGTAWKQASTPTPPAMGDQARLIAVSMVSATNVWAVGDLDNTYNGGKDGTYILHWNGTKWTHVYRPN